MNDIKNKLERVVALIEGWESRGGLQDGTDDLERDLALELLREVYAALKFGAAAAKTAIEPEQKPEPEPEPEPEHESQPAAIVDDEGLEGEDCEIVAAATIPEPKPESEFGQSPLVARRVAPEVIRSLYGSDTDEADEATDTNKTSEPESMTEQELKPEHEPEPEHESRPEQEPVQERKSEPEPKPATTLGDAMASGHKTLGETLRSGERDMATHIAAAERPGLKRSIGLNDRFLMIRDMFDGNAAAFDSAITTLDAFTDLDEAIIWIHDNFEWSADSRGATLLVGLLERKLGH